MKQFIGSLPEAAVRYCNERWDGPEHSDINFRLREMDRDGVAAEVIYHGSVTDHPMVFGGGLVLGDSTSNRELEAVGQQIYNRWLSDAISTAPDRLIGLAHIPMWDPQSAVRAVETAAKLGLRGLNFPGPHPEILAYSDARWEPFWSVCEDAGMVLCTHGGAVERDPQSRNDGQILHWYIQIENGGYRGRAGLHRMIFSGVFERHPRLNLMLTEQNGDWWRSTMAEFDSVYLSFAERLDTTIPRRPSEYCASNVSIGASFMAPFEAEQAIQDGYSLNTCWGRDFPHPEGTWKPGREGEEPITRLQLRYAFSNIDQDNVRLMAGDNLVRIFGLDREALVRIADRIDAPTYDELATPVTVIPEDAGWLSFRTVGPWG